MTIKITRDVNLDEKAIHIENDKLTVHVSDNPNNKLVKTENGLEVLLDADSTNVSDTWMTQEEVNTYLQENYPEYREVTERNSLYNPKTKTYKEQSILTKIERMEDKYITLENSTVEYTLSNYENLTPEEFANKYTNTPENTLDHLKEVYDEPVTFLVGDLVVKFEFLKDEFLKDEFLKDFLSEHPILAYIHDKMKYRQLFGYESLNKEVSEDVSYWYLTLTYEKYTEIKTNSWDGRTYTISNTDQYPDYKEHEIRSLSDSFHHEDYGTFSVTTTKEIEVDPKLNVPVVLHTNYTFNPRSY